MKIKHLLLGMLAMAAAVACKQDEPVEEAKLEVSTETVVLEAAAAEATFEVTSNNDWTATADADWVTLDPASGAGAAEAVTVKVTAEDNEAEEARTATVTVKAGEHTKTVALTQAGTEAVTPELPTPNADWTSDAVVSYDLPESASSKRQLLKNIKYLHDENYFYVKLQASVAEFTAAPAEFLGIFVYDVTNGSGDGYYGWWNDAKGNVELEGEHIGTFNGKDITLTIGETPVEVVTEENGDELVWTLNIPRSAHENLALENPHFAFLTYIGWEPNGALPDKYENMLQFTPAPKPIEPVTEGVIWENTNGVGPTSWNNTYRFSIEGGDSKNECVAEIPAAVWAGMKTTPFTVNITPDATKEWWMVRILDGWWTTDDKGASDITPETTGLVNYGDGTYAFQVDLSTKPELVNLMDTQHLLFTGDAYTINKIYFGEPEAPAQPEEPVDPDPTGVWAGENVVTYVLDEFMYTSYPQYCALTELKAYADDTNIYARLKSNKSAGVSKIRFCTADTKAGSESVWYWESSTYSTPVYKSDKASVDADYNFALSYNGTPVTLVTKVSGEDIYWEMTIPRSAHEHTSANSVHIGFLSYDANGTENGFMPKVWGEMMKVVMGEEPAGPDGTEANPYLVADAAALQGMGALLVADATTYFKLTANIDLAGTEWTPISTTETVEDATVVKAIALDGANFTISNAKDALFSTLCGSVQNLTIDGAAINATNTVGVIANQVDDATIKNVVVKNSSIVSTAGEAGGVVGKLTKGTLENVQSACSVSGTQQLGGLVGVIYDGIIKNCVATGEVTGANYYIGGLVGYVKAGTIQNCSASGNVTSTSTAYSRLGGLVGQIDNATITSCHATGNVKGDGHYCGGLIGVCVTGKINVSQSYATGNIIMPSSVNKSGGAGLIGVIESGDVTVANCYATGDVTAHRWSAAFIGRVAAGTLSVTNCYSKSNCTFTQPDNCGALTGELNAKATMTYSGVVVWNLSDLNLFIRPDVTTAPEGNYYGVEGTISAKAKEFNWDESVWDLSADDPTLK